MTKPQDKMEPGEKELREIFEKTTISNIKTVISYNDQTQKLVKELEDKVGNLDGVVRQYDTLIDSLRKQITVLQTKVFQGGS
jgi:ABC-type Zn uptake system ZnuABC Zn-binding protein ZnuA